MMTVEVITAFLGWCSLINIGILLFSTVILMVLREPVTQVHSRLFGLNREDLPLVYFQYLGNYKIALIVLNLVPYLAFRIMA